MNAVETATSLGNINLTLIWRVKKQVMYLYEVDADAVAHFVPPSLEMIEVRPGRALFAVEALHYHTGHFGKPDSPEFYEAVFTIAVQPDLSVPMPVPRFCMHAVAVISDSEDFCAQEHRLLHTPTELVPGLTMEFTADGASCIMKDGDQLIIDMKNTAGGVQFEPKKLYGQYYTNTKGLQHGLWTWQGQMFEHQKVGDYGVIGDHPFWKGLDLRRVRGCYRQMVAKPDLVTEVHFFHRGLTKQS
ncbi:MAG: hypothetical protein QM831_00590 [Kofleriaceae bacterium]